MCCVSEGRVNKFVVEFCNKIIPMSNFIINVAVMNIYREPTFQSEVITQGLLGETCTIIDQSNDWAKIKQWDGYTGWANNFHGIIQDEDYIATHSFLIHSGEIVNSESEIIRTIYFGGNVDAESNGKNYSVILPDGIKGFIEENLVSKTLTPKRNSIVNLAQSFLGVPYLWGGKSSMGFDCSGFVQSVYKAHNIELPRDTYMQEEHFKKEINLNESLPGDLLFFAEKNKISHVAISLGGEDFINARGWVRNESLNSSNDVYCQKLKENFVKVVSIKELVIS